MTSLYLPNIQRKGNGQPPAVVGLPVGLGCGLPWQNAERDPDWYDRATLELQPHWWYNWKYDQLGKDNVGYFPMLWAMKRDRHYTEAVEKAKIAPDRFWLMGNEPERGEQSNTNPFEAAGTMRHWHEHTPVLWACPGIIVSPAGLSWLNAYIGAGGPIPSAWHVHIYAQSVSQWWAWMARFDDWMAQKRLTRPVIVSETFLEVPEAEPQEKLLAMLGTVLDQKLVQAVAWFSACYEPMSWTDLIAGDELTALGVQFRSVSHG